MQINFKIRKNHIKSIKIHANKGLNIKKIMFNTLFTMWFCSLFYTFKGNRQRMVVPVPNVLLTSIFPP